MIQQPRVTKANMDLCIINFQHSIIVSIMAQLSKAPKTVFWTVFLYTGAATGFFLVRCMNLRISWRPSRLVPCSCILFFFFFCSCILNNRFYLTSFFVVLVAFSKICDFARSICGHCPGSSTQAKDPFPDLLIRPPVCIHVDPCLLVVCAQKK